METTFFTSESVTEGHPDKVADAISDAVLDQALTINPYARVACEVFVTTNLVVVGGEISAGAEIDIEPLVRSTIKEIGYDGFDPRFAHDGVEIDNRVQAQSADIAAGVDEKLGAGDQGMMFGFAVTETQELMPMPIHLAHRLSQRLTEVRKTGKLDFLRPDGKTQVMVRYEGSRPVAVDKVLISAHHVEGMSQDEMAEGVRSLVIDDVIPDELKVQALEFIFNPTGVFTIGGPVADTGLTGRKVIVDTYGGYARHGGGAFSGKDATKVDRSGAYAARWAAKNLVAAGLADRLEIQIAYAIGRTEPFSTHVETFGTEKIAPEVIRKVVDEVFDFRPASIIDALDLCRPGFAPAAAYGHFGRPEFTWERLDRVDAIKSAANL